VLRHAYTIHFTPTFKLVQQLLAAKRDLKLESLLRRLDRFDAVVLDDLGYVEHSREEMEVLFTFLAERYERRSVWVSSNLVFSKWDQIFKDPMTTMAAVDRLVHHSIILEFTARACARTGRRKKAAAKTGAPPPSAPLRLGRLRLPRLRCAEGGGRTPPHQPKPNAGPEVISNWH
jgi:DNA replication protein DnaC